ncbi:MAG: signal recognition particle protein [Anaerolineales bacterium]|jgi:signal recognition particle subunit SRP54
MFEVLSSRLQSVFQQLRRRGRLSEADVEQALRQVRLALLEADVNFRVVNDLLERIRVRCVGVEVSRAFNPSQQVLTVVYEELVRTLDPRSRWSLTGPKPRVIVLVGLQGSGKTTTAAKLARRLLQDGERVLLVAADIQRPAAAEQLRLLAERIGVPAVSQGTSVLEICHAAVERACREGDSVVILDTAGRMQVNEELMDELREIKASIQPTESLLVADAMTGQEAVNIAQGFHSALGLTGIILTKVDGDARGGAAVSMRAVTEVPIRWVGLGEGVEALEEFDPERFASRILGMGDIRGLMEKAEQAFDLQGRDRTAQSVLAGPLTLEDMVSQLRQVRKLGPFSAVLETLPAPSLGGLPRINPDEVDRRMRTIEAILLSMTAEERRSPEILNASRRRRIASGSGTQVQEINQLLRQFREAQKAMRNLPRLTRGRFPGIFG